MRMACLYPWMPGVSSEGDSKGWGLEDLGLEGAPSKTLFPCVSWPLAVPELQRGVGHCACLLAGFCSSLASGSWRPSVSAEFYLQIRAVSPSITAGC